MEYWDVIDRKRTPLGKRVLRGAPLGTGEYHLAVSIWTVNERHELLLTLRSPEKKSYPGLWENTAGAVLAGEGSRAAAVRELWEETGIRASEEELVPLGVQRRAHLFVDVYALRRTVPIEKLRLQPGETVAARWVTFPAFLELVRRGEVAEPVYDRLQLMREPFLRFLEGGDSDSVLA